MDKVQKTTAIENQRPATKAVVLRDVLCFVNWINFGDRCAEHDWSHQLQTYEIEDKGKY